MVATDSRAREGAALLEPARLILLDAMHENAKLGAFLAEEIHGAAAHRWAIVTARFGDIALAWSEHGYGLTLHRAYAFVGAERLAIWSSEFGGFYRPGPWWSYVATEVPAMMREELARHRARVLAERHERAEREAAARAAEIDAWNRTHPERR